MTLNFSDPNVYNWVVLPVLIFLARIADVTIGTVRIIFVAKGKKFSAALCGFFEVIIWLAAMSQIIQNLSNVVCYIAYGSGFAMGNFIGITVEEKLALGLVIVRVFTNEREGAVLMENFRKAGYGVTILDGRGCNGPVKIIYTVIRRGALPEVDRIIHQFKPDTFYAVEEVRSAHAGVFPAPRYPLRK